jgi:hypothetical protein
MKNTKKVDPEIFTSPFNRSLVLDPKTNSNTVKTNFYQGKAKAPTKWLKNSASYPPTQGVFNT